LQTVILTPANATKPLPILFRRTPYGVPEKAPAQVPANLKELMQDGYIFVVQNLRGRFKSEGYFKLSSQVDLNDPKATNETTDAYDSIEWLIKNVPNNNGKVGMFGVSYDGLTTALALLHPHPALKAIQRTGFASGPVDERRYAPLRSATRELRRRIRRLGASRQNENTNFKFETYDTFEWYLGAGPLANINENICTTKFRSGTTPSRTPTMTTSGKKKPGSVNSMLPPFPISTCGILDQEDPWGPWEFSVTLPSTIPITPTSSLLVRVPR